MLANMNIALATQDGIVTGMSDNEQKHPLYGTPSYEIRLETPLTDDEVALADALWGEGCTTQTIHHSVRSFAAQLGFGGFGVESGTTQVALAGKRIISTTLATDISNEDPQYLLASLRSAIGAGAAKLSRVLLLPQQAFNREVDMPVHADHHYRFRRDDIADLLPEVWQGESGRRIIVGGRDDLGQIPSHLEPGSFFVGDVTANVGEQELWVLQSEVYRGDKMSRVLHENSVLFDPRRTTGTRQVEIRNCNGERESTSGLTVRAKVYSTDPEKLHGQSLTGV